MDERPFIYDLDFPALSTVIQSWAEPDYRAIQVWEALYKHLGRDPLDEDAIKAWSSLPIKFRHHLGEAFRFEELIAQRELVSGDGNTEKVLFALPDEHAIESVLMRYHPHKKNENSYTLCVSSQVGCAMGCVFCATGRMGFSRNLSAGEIVSQVIHFARRLSTNAETLSNVVVMGMGEPFLNYENTLQAIAILHDERGFNMGERRFTISTVGIIPMIDKFTSEQSQVNLSVSLHAIEDDLRSYLLPINRKFPVKPLLEACRRYTLQTRRRITFEWALIEGVNDSRNQALQLAGVLKGMLCHVNLIPLNPIADYRKQASSRERALDFQAALEEHGISCTLRLRMGIDIQAGCGQLIYSKSMKEAVENPARKE